MKIYIDRKYTVWEREYYDVNDISEKTIQDCIESIGYRIDRLNETEEMMTPSENCGNSTIEIYNENNNLIYSNGIPSK